MDYKKYKLPSYPNHKENKLIRFDSSLRKWYYINQNNKLEFGKKHKNFPKKTNPKIEIKRYNTYNKLKQYFIKLIDNIPYKKKNDLFEIWFWYQQLMQIEFLDPLIPYKTNIHDKGIYNIFEQHKINSKDINNILQKIDLFSYNCSLELNSYIKNKDSKIDDIIITYEKSDDIFLYSINDIKLSIYIWDYNKLKSWYSGNSFNNDLFCMLLRYYTIGDTTSQAALPKNVFQFLENKLKIKQESFASPLNAYYSTYCSVFEDTDKYFGSIGSFFNFYPTKGIFEANPPFNEIYMQKMLEHIEYLLSNTNDLLSFLIIIPKWNDDASPIWQSITNSKYNKLYFDIESNKHQYYTGDKYRKKNNKLWIARHTTSIFLLTNSKEINNINFIKNNILKIWK